MVRVGGRVTSPPLFVNYTAPKIVSVSPRNDYTSGGAILSVYGSNFGSITLVTTLFINGRSCNVYFLYVSISYLVNFCF